MSKGIFNEMSKGEFGNIPGAERFLGINKPIGWGENGIIYIGVGSTPDSPFASFFGEGSFFGIGFTNQFDPFEIGEGGGNVGIQDDQPTLVFNEGSPNLYNDGGTSDSGASGQGGLDLNGPGGNGVNGVGSTSFNTGYGP